MLHQTGAGSALVFLLALAISILVFYFVMRWIHRSLSKLGLSPGEVSAIIWVTLIGSFITIPLFPFGEGAIGINVGGGVVPVVLSLYLINRKRLPLNEIFVGTLLVTAVTFLVTEYRPGVGVVSEFPLWLLPALTAFVVAAAAYWHERENSASIAYVVGTLGVIIGADLLRLPEILAGPRPEEPVVLAIGGAAVFDMVFLTGILAITMETGLLTKRRYDLARGGAGNRIDAEYEAWLRKKEQEWAGAKRETERARAAYMETHPSRRPSQPRKEPQRWQPAQTGRR